MSMLKGCPICFSLSFSGDEIFLDSHRQAKAYRTLVAHFSSGMFIVEHGGKLRPEEKYQTRHVTPGQYCYHRADRAINLIVVKIIQAPGKDILCQLPKKATQKSARKSISQGDLCAGHEAIDEN